MYEARVIISTSQKYLLLSAYKKLNTISVFSKILHAVLQPWSKCSDYNVKIGVPMQTDTNRDTDRYRVMSHSATVGQIQIQN